MKKFQNEQLINIEEIIESTVKILIVDDDRISRLSIRKMLCRNDIKFHFDEASDRESALEMVTGNRYDCIILDYILQDSDGLELLTTFRRLKIMTPVIMLTGQGDEILAARALKAGASDYLTKSMIANPDSRDILITTVLGSIQLFHSKEEKKRAEKIIRKSEERYRGLVENSPILILRFFPDDLMVNFANSSFCEYFDINELDIVGENLLSLLPRDRIKRMKGILASLNRENPRVTVEYEHEQNGEKRWQFWNIQALFDSQGEIMEYQCLGEDISGLKRVEQELYRQKIHLQSILDSQDSMVIEIDSSRDMHLANNRFLNFFGCESLEVFNENFPDLSSLMVSKEGYLPETSGLNWLDYVFTTPDRQHLVIFKPEEAGGEKIFSVTVKKLSVDVDRFVVTFSDVTELQEKSRLFENRATYDILTNIYNRRKFEEMLSHTFELSLRYNNSLSVIFFDIDRFKVVNDTYGHQAGDYVLQKLAEIVKSNIRKIDIFARWGGEEFILLLPQTDIRHALTIAEKFRLMIQDYDFRDIGHITCSFGVTSYREGDTKDRIIQRVDNAMYKAKQTGRNCVVGIKGGT